jgi:hypothetical protein
MIVNKLAYSQLSQFAAKHVHQQGCPEDTKKKRKTTNTTHNNQHVHWIP